MVRIAVRDNVTPDLDAAAVRMPAAANLAMVALAKEAAIIARSSHRFTSRTGNLENNIKVLSDGRQVVFKIDQAGAPYGGYIDQGFRSWGADPFMENGIAVAEAKAESTIANTVADEFRRKGFVVS